MCIRDRCRIGNIYTAEAYQYMKRLEFKSLLTRFDGNVPPALEIEKHFKVVRDLGEAEQVFERAGACETAGLQLISDENGAVGLALCFGEEDIYCLPAQGFLTSGYLADKAAKMCIRDRQCVPAFQRARVRGWEVHLQTAGGDCAEA